MSTTKNRTPAIDIGISAGHREKIVKGVPISWTLRAESRQTTPLGTRAETSASERCSLISAPGRP